MKRFNTICLMLLAFCGFSQNDTLQKDQQFVEIPILWKSISSADYSFHEQWEYPDGVYENQWGQLSCDGFCPEGTDPMKDSQGKIYDDSLEAFYTLVDTTHLFYSIKCDASMYEFAGTNYIHFSRANNAITGITEASASTHCSLKISIVDGKCSAWVEYNSVLPNRPEMLFLMSDGRIILDDKAFAKGIVKGFFDFRFANTLEPTLPLSWSGFIYSEMQEAQ